MMQQDHQAIVLDTNIVLDLLLFDDAAAAPLRAAMQLRALHWVATPRMREELARVLRYPQIAGRCAFYQRTDIDILQRMDVLVRYVEPAPRCTVVCKDTDDQCFIDLAVQQQALLLSKDDQVLRLRKRLLKLYGVQVARSLPAAALITAPVSG